jgi:hypothetical protein
MTELNETRGPTDTTSPVCVHFVHIVQRTHDKGMRGTGKKWKDANNIATHETDAENSIGHFAQHYASISFIEASFFKYITFNYMLQLCIVNKRFF